MVQDAVALSQNLVAFRAEVELFTDIAHVEEFLVVFLQEAGLVGGTLGSASRS